MPIKTTHAGSQQISVMCVIRRHVAQGGTSMTCAPLDVGTELDVNGNALCGSAARERSGLAAGGKQDGALQVGVLCQSR